MIIPDKDTSGNIVNHPANVRIDENHRVRHCGMINQTITNGTEVDIDWQIPQMTYNQANVPSVMVGVAWKLVGGNDGDELDFCVGDKDGVMVGILYDQATFDALKTAGGGFVSLDAFADTYYLFKDQVGEMREHKADLITGLYIRAHYKNTGAADATFICNLLRYIYTGA